MFYRQNLFLLNFRIFLVILILISGFFVLPAKPLLADEGEDDEDEQKIIITQNKTLTEDINGSVIIGANDITLDCDGHKIIGFGADDGYGVYLYSKNNVTVKNCIIENFYSGIYSDCSTNSAFVKNNISNNEMGVFLICSSDNKISENNIFDNGLGLGISNACLASDNLVYHNNFKNNQAQAFLDDNSHNDLFDNGHPDGGNYWSDYNTPAKGCSNANGDDFCDAPYIFMSDGEDRYPFVKESGWEEEAPEWRKSILAGDILYDPFASGAGHIGLYVGDNKVVEAVGYPVWQSDYPGKVEKNPITSWDYPQKDAVYLLRVKKPDDLNDTEWNQKIIKAIDFAKQQQSPTAKPYDWHWYQKQSSIDSPSWYCSELVWAAYYNQGVDLEYRSDGAVFDLIDPVSPVEIFDDEDTSAIGLHLEGFDDTPWYREFAPLFVLSPVNVIITDKDGNTIDQSTVEESGINIPGATFVEDQTDADGHKYSIIYLPVEYGPYQIQVIRKADACDEDAYSLKTQTESGDIWLAQDHPVPADDEIDEYIFDPAALNNNPKAGGFNDIEESPNNTCQAGTLDFALSPSEIGGISIDVSIVQKGTLGFQYKIRTEVSEEEFCKDLEISATIDGNIYTGELENFNKSDFTFSAPDDWEFKITDPENNPEGETCDFNIIFEGWQEDINDYEDGGFTDEEIISETVESEGEILPPPPELGDVIINEVMWMGSKKDDGTGKSSDEWIELHNTTDYEINIGQCEIENARSSGNSLMIPANKTILPNNYFLIAHWPETSANSALNVEVDEVNASISLQNNYDINGALILKNKEGTAIDSTPIPVNDNWPAGESSSTKKWSMEWGDDDSGWHTCDPLTPLTMSAADLALMKSYWDSDAQDYNCGTPGAENL